MKIFSDPEIQIIDFEENIVAQSGCYCVGGYCLDVCDSDVTCKDRCRDVEF